MQELKDFFLYERFTGLITLCYYRSSFQDSDNYDTESARGNAPICKSIGRSPMRRDNKTPWTFKIIP